MLSNGLHGQMCHSLSVFVPTLAGHHYSQLAQHLHPERRQEHKERRYEIMERRYERRVRH